MCSSRRCTSTCPRSRGNFTPNLTPGTKLRRSGGTTVTLVGLRNFHRRGTTYDLTVGTLHTYYVFAGEPAVLVHNCPAGPGDLPDFTDGTPQLRKPGTGAGREGETSAEAEKLTEEGQSRKNTTAGAADKVATVTQNVADVALQHAGVEEPVSSIATPGMVVGTAVSRAIRRRS